MYLKAASTSVGAVCRKGYNITNEVQDKSTRRLFGPKRQPRFRIEHPVLTTYISLSHVKGPTRAPSISGDENSGLMVLPR